MSANDTQHGGTHYSGSYQHWDWVADVRLPYHPATATKYLARWEKKGTPLLDLQKAGHYLDKTMEIGRTPSLNKLEIEGIQVFTRRFASSQGLGLLEEEALLAIAVGQYGHARVIVSNLARSMMEKEAIRQAAEAG